MNRHMTTEIPSGIASPDAVNTRLGTLKFFDGSRTKRRSRKSTTTLRMEHNWIQTIPGKGWNMLFRLYGPLEPWFDKTWKLSEIERVN